MSIEYTKVAEKVLMRTNEVAAKFNTATIDTTHLAFALISTRGVAARILVENGGDKEKVLDMIFESMGRCQPDEQLEPSPRFKEVVEHAERIAKSNKDKKVGTEHLLIALLLNKNCTGTVMLQQCGIDVRKAYLDANKTIGIDDNAAIAEYSSAKKKKKKKNKHTMLKEYGTDLNELALAGDIDPVYGRQEELDSMIETLSRRKKNNPCLVGDPGVGKTALAEGLALRLVEGNVPESVKKKRIVSLDLTGMVAGAKYRGEFEQRIKDSIKEAIDDGNVILFIDELHTVIGAGGAEGSIDASNILKPALARGELQVIGATTREEYRKYLEKDAALERRFQQINIDEPSVPETVAMLRGLKDKYEEFHGLSISDEAIEAAAKLSDRYISDRFLPDKAIDLIDEASARLRLLSALKKDKDIEECDVALEEYQGELERALKEGDLDYAVELRELQDKMNQKKKRAILRQEKRTNQRKIVLEERHIQEMVARKTNIPVSRLEKTETKRLAELEKTLHKRVIGQEEAVDAVSRAVRRGRVGLKDAKRPIGSFLFLGPTGVGKTELSKALAEAVFGDEKDIIRVDMSEYMEKHSAAKIIGSPPGYVGYDDGGQLTEKVRNKPYSVILFDEIEKAHPDVFNVLLQILEDGQVTDSHGKTVDFKNTIIIMTSNAGANRIIAPKTLGFVTNESREENHKRMKDGVMEEVKHIFKPEFLNRVDDIIVFQMLTKDEIGQIAKLLLDSFKKRVKEQLQINITIPKKVVEYIADKGFDKDYGARPLRRAIQRDIEDCIAEEIVNKNVIMGDNIRLALEEDKILVKKSK
ncbi:MAG: ATP-dependent Clp protease ATP-binding subunit [Eubacterium sp.]|nr:ATP-dependent Clp protease ATP-binding subunit [Eubacterium sp.]